MTDLSPDQLSRPSAKPRPAPRPRAAAPRPRKPNETSQTAQYKEDPGTSTSQQESNQTDTSSPSVQKRIPQTAVKLPSMPSPIVSARRPRTAAPERSPPVAPKKTEGKRSPQQRPSPLVISKDTRARVQYPGYTPTTPPTLEQGGRLVRFAGGFEVVDTYGADEYERRNAESDPVFSSAVYALEKMVEQMETFVVELRKTENNVGLGLSVIGKSMVEDPALANVIVNIYVKAIKEGGPAALDGRIAVGDCLTEVDGQSMIGISTSSALSLLGATGQKVELKVARRSAPEADEEVKRLKDENIAFIEQIERLSTEKSFMEAKLHAAEAAVNGSLSCSVEIQKQEVVTLESENAGLREKLKAAEELASNADSESKEVKQRREEALQQLADVRGTVNEMKQQISKLEGENKALAEELKSGSSIGENSPLDSELAAAKTRVKQLEAEIEESWASRNAEARKLEALRAELTDESNSTRLVEERAVSLGESVRKAKARNEELEQHVVNLEAYIDERDAEWEMAEKRLAESNTIIESERVLRRAAEQDVEEMKKKMANACIAPRKTRRPVLNHSKGDEVELSAVSRAPLLDVSATRDKARLNQPTRRRRPSREMLQRNATPEAEAPSVPNDHESDDEARPRQRSMTTVPKIMTLPKAIPIIPPRKSSLQPDDPLPSGLTVKEPSDRSYARRSMTMSEATKPLAKFGSLFEKGVPPLRPLPTKVSPRRFASDPIGDNVVTDSTDSSTKVRTLPAAARMLNIPTGPPPASHPAAYGGCSNATGDDDEDEKKEDNDDDLPPPPPLSVSIPPPPESLAPILSSVSSEGSLQLSPTGIQLSASMNSLPVLDEDCDSDEMTSTNLGDPVFGERPEDAASCHRRQSRTVIEWNRVEVNQWLSVIKMNQYAKQFEEHGVVGSHLPELDDTKLKSIGVKSSDRSAFKKEAKAMRLQLEKMKKMQKKKQIEDLKLEKKRQKEALKMSKRVKKSSRTSSED